MLAVRMTWYAVVLRFHRVRRVIIVSVRDRALWIAMADWTLLQVAYSASGAWSAIMKKVNIHRASLGQAESKTAVSGEITML